MPFSIRPSTIKALIPTIGANFCDKFLRSITGIPQAFYALVLDMIDESGFPSTNFKTMICALNCVSGGGGGGTPNPNMDAPSGVNATDGAFSDKVRVSWNAVTAPTGIAAVTTYKVYRSLSTNTDPNVAALIASVAAPTTIYDDTSVAAGTTYNYWIKASNGVDESAFSADDVGSAAAPSGDIDAISDLLATQGYSENDSRAISLVFTAPAGATKYSVYRNTVNDFATATIIDTLTDIAPQNIADHYISTQSPDQCWDNVTGIVIFHFPPSPTVHYFFWVKAKKDSPPAVSLQSNSAEGWTKSHYAPFLGNAFKLTRGQSATEGAEFTGTSIRVVLFGPGGGGAGGSQIFGGGGGGAGPVIVEEFAISGGDVVSLVSTPDQDDTGNAAALANGDAFTKLDFKINGVTKMSASGGGGGQFSASGGGAGGTGATGTGTATPTIHNGHAGLPGVGPAGGPSGYVFGNKRIPSAHFNNFSLGGFDGNGFSEAYPGGGSKAAPGTEVLAVGGFGRSGYAVIVSTVL